MDTKLLTHIAYRALVEEIAEIDARMLHASDAALPQQRVWRQIATRHDTWATRREWTRKEYEADEARLGKLVPLLEELEALYKRHHDADDAAWNDAMADYFKQNRSK